MRIANVEKLTEKEKQNKKFYDVVGVEGNKNFFVNVDESNSSDHNSYEGIVSHNCGILDEVEFFAGSDKDIIKSKIMKIYRTIKRRMESRYMQKGGDTAGMLFLVSSKQSKYDFLEQYVQKVKSDEKIKVVDEPLWKVKTKDYSGEMMKVAVGNRFLSSKILEEGEDELLYINQGYDIIEVPVEHRRAFELDINAALMDIAGISISSTTKYIYGSRLQSCTDESRPNPFNQEIIIISFDDETVDIKDYLNEDKIHPADIRKPAFAHIDTSKSGDRTGLSLVTVEGTTKSERLENGEVFEVTDLMYKVVLSVGLEAAKGSEIPFYKIREFYYYLRDELGFDIKSITCDGYQSVDMIQQFKLHGFESKTVSVDRTSDPYSVLRTAINEGRMNFYKHSVLEDELVELEEDKLNDKIDHPVDGSKDLSDSIAGAVYTAAQNKDIKDVVEKSIDMDKILDVLNALEKEQGSGKEVIDSMEQDMLGDGRKAVPEEKDRDRFFSNVHEDSYIDELLD